MEGESFMFEKKTKTPDKKLICSECRRVIKPNSKYTVIKNRIYCAKCAQMKKDWDFMLFIRNKYLVNFDLDGEPKVKLKQIESDSGVYEKLIMGAFFDESAFTDKEKQSNVYRNYMFMRDLIQQSEVTHDDLYGAVTKLEIIDVMLTTEDPQEVFESMNSTGKNLTNTDLLRNYLLMDLPYQTQSTFYNNYWKRIEKQVGSRRMEQFMVHYLIMKRKTDSVQIRKRSGRINKSNLYECYRQYYSPEMKNDEATQDLLQDMEKYSLIYSRIYKEMPATELEKALYEIIYDLNAEPAAIFLMYLMSLDVSDKELTKAAEGIIAYIFRLRIFKTMATSGKI